ncbi:DUF3800 domain-containing protein [Dyella flava]|uniref:DUF3800 domain-containing protein n=1 Tax=Dyella flava TaxID=1920170 RepID=A0ABS2JY96_9GAMM|nr:DUF3800 domain-containing protein [Dyella flava]MBM7123959.1 DUF3800 domain-containing protein [Dyella flava]GLQ52515.1 hypothetical protein GCM10010872_39640 [Dyella flava]
MHIFIDESGTFAAAESLGSFCLVLAYVVPESQLSKAKDVLRRWKVANGFRHDQEPKPRKVISEDAYFHLLQMLARLDCLVFAVASDAALNVGAEDHKNKQAAIILEREESMIYPEGKAMVRNLANAVSALSTQQWIETLCRAHLVVNVLRYSTPYYSLRIPGTLGSFRWNFDRKDIQKNQFDETFSTVTLPLTQTIVLERPMINVEGGNYSMFQDFYDTRPYPTWLPKPSDAKESDRLLDAQKIWANRKFVDSKTSPGVQLADLISNGVYRLLNGRFNDGQRAADCLAPLFLQPEKGEPFIQFIVVGQGDDPYIGKPLSQLLRQMARNTKDMLPPSYYRRVR